MAKLIKLIPLLLALALLAGVPAAVSGQTSGEPFERNPAEDFDRLSLNGNPRGIWSNGVTMWVVDDHDNKIYAYNLETKQRDASKEFNDLDAYEHSRPWGIWSDGTTMWMSDWWSEKIFAYNLATKQRDPDKDFDTLDDAGHDWPEGICGYESTMWVVESVENKLFAYNLETKARQPDMDFDTLETAGNEHFGGIWCDGTTMWVADWGDDKLYAYDMSTKDRDSDKDLDDLAAAGNELPEGIWSNGTTMWVTDLGDSKIYAYDLATKARDPAKDLATLDPIGNTSATGIWSNGTTMWVADRRDDKLYAYNLTTKNRDPDDDFETLADAGNDFPEGIWSNGTTMWVADRSDSMLYAYSMATKQRDPTRDIETKVLGQNLNIRDIWSNGTTIWVAGLVGNKLYAFNLATKERDSDKDFPSIFAGYGHPAGIWSDGTSMWVSGYDNRAIFAYNLETKRRDRAKEFSTRIFSRAGQDYLTNLWSDGTTMWVVEDFEERIYAYNMPAKDCSIEHPEPKVDAVNFLQGVINGQRLGCSSPSISVAPGQRISGSLTILVTNAHGSHAVFPVGSTPSWGDHETRYWQIDRSAPARTDTTYRVPIGLTAPSTPGTYSIWFAAGAEITLAHVMSCTFWAVSSPLWNDGNDVAGWETSQTRCDPTITPNSVGLRVAVNVQQPPAPPDDPEPEPPDPSVIKVDKCVSEVESANSAEVAELDADDGTGSENEDADDEAGSIVVGDTITGKWEGGCPSITRGARKAKYYTFNLPITTTVEIALDSRLDDYLVLRGGGLSGDVVAQDDDGGPGNNSLIAETLPAGEYTIEATTFYPDGVEAEFTLSVTVAPRVLYSGPIADASQEGYAPDGPTLTVRMLPTMPTVTLEITIEDEDGFGEGAGPLGGTQTSEGSSGMVVIALPKTAVVDYDGIAIEVRESGGWSQHTLGDEQGLLALGVGTGQDDDFDLTALLEALERAEDASDFVQSLVDQASELGNAASSDLDEAILDPIFRQNYANCVAHSTVPWLVSTSDVTGVRVSVPVELADDDYLSLAAGFVASGNEPALAQLHDLLATGEDMPGCQQP